MVIVIVRINTHRGLKKMIVILEIKPGAKKIVSAWDARDIQDAANKVAFKNGGWTQPYQIDAEIADDMGNARLTGFWIVEGGVEPVADQPDADEAADEFVRSWYGDNARSCIILTSMAEAADYLNCTENVLETIARAF